MKLFKFIAIALMLFAVEAVSASTTCTLTEGATIFNRKGVKGYLYKMQNGRQTLLRQMPTTKAGWAGVTVKIANNTDENYDQAILLTYDTNDKGGFFSSTCKCANKDIPEPLQRVCKNSSQGKILALGKQTRTVKRKITGQEKQTLEQKRAHLQQEVAQEEANPEGTSYGEYAEAAADYEDYATELENQGVDVEG